MKAGTAKAVAVIIGTVVVCVLLRYTLLFSGGE